MKCCVSYAYLAIVPIFYLQSAWGCSEDIRICPDGTAIYRDPEQNCDFPQCQEIYKDPTSEDNDVCPGDVKLCSNGQVVKRNPENDCDFFSCEESITDVPKVVPTCNIADVILCDDMITEVHRNPSNNCEFDLCPGEGSEEGHDGGNHVEDCDTSEEILCDDMVTKVHRNPSNNCEFDLCPGEGSEEGHDGGNHVEDCDTSEEILCDDMVTKVYRNPSNNCEFDLCPGEEEMFPIVATCDDSKLRKCPDGSIQIPDPHYNCLFPDPCPEFLVIPPKSLKLRIEQKQFVECPTDVKRCDDGTWRERQPDFDCNFPSC